MHGQHAATNLTTVGMLERLVSFDTTGRNSSLPLIACVRADPADPGGWQPSPGGDRHRRGKNHHGIDRTGSNATGKAGFGTEVSFYQAAGIRTIICGPGHIVQARLPDEFIAQTEPAACGNSIRRLVDRLAV